MRRSPRACLALGGVTICLIGASLAWHPAKRLVINTTTSAPLGFYWMSGSVAKVGDLALVRPPADLARWMAMRRYLPLNVPLIKHVAAVGGQGVCSQDGVIRIDGQDVVTALKADRAGRALRPTTICRRLTADEVFLLNSHAPRSFDGRYFGPLPRHCVLGRLTPLWTWER
jgi:conjugative transfer signal peptidase TraF